MEYREGVQIGYRYYDTHDTPVKFCFGHGLSYTTFAYSDCSVTVCSGEKVMCKVSFTIKNTGAREGMETVQLYVRPIDSRVERPMHELKAFTKVRLKPQEEKRVEFTLQDQDFAYYDAETHDFAVEPGTYEIQIGASSRDIRLCSEIFF